MPFLNVFSNATHYQRTGERTALPFLQPQPLTLIAAGLDGGFTPAAALVGGLNMRIIENTRAPPYSQSSTQQPRQWKRLGEKEGREIGQCNMFRFKFNASGMNG